MPYKTKNSLKSKDIFLKRATYLLKADEHKQEVSSLVYENFLNFHFGEKHLYGRVGRNFVPITIVDLFDNIKTISSPSNDQTQHRAACFVVDQFNDLKSKFDKEEEKNIRNILPLKSFGY